jgi:hypothetical protein
VYGFWVLGSRFRVQGSGFKVEVKVTGHWILDA